MMTQPTNPRGRHHDLATSKRPPPSEKVDPSEAPQKAERVRPATWRRSDEGEPTIVSVLWLLVPLLLLLLGALLVM